jgi:adenylate cyclase
MYVPTAFKSSGNTTKVFAIGLIGTIATVLAVLAANVPPVGMAMQRVDLALYDAFYRSRPSESRQSGPVIIIAVDQSSIDRMAASELKHRWEWPREFWGALLGYLERAGSRAVAVDLLFEEPSRYNNEFGDDNTFASQIDALKIPVVYAAQLSKPTDATRFAPPVTRPPRLGAVDVIDDAVVRGYNPFVNDRPSLAVETVRAAGGTIPDWASAPFLLHYYGPTRHADGADTYRYVPAFDVLTAMSTPDGKAGPITPELFKDKIVVIGTTAAATFDLKSSPVSAIYPSVEAQATAIDNLLQGQRVIPIGWMIRMGIAWLGAILATAGTMLPRAVWMKVFLSLAALAAVFAAGYVLFATGASIYWLALCMPLLATSLAMVIGLAWSYFVEDRRRRAMLKFLSQYVSPHVAAELSRQNELSLVGQRREMTVMFTDIAGFTQLADKLPVDTLEQFMSLYLNEMSGGVFDFDGTLDKYIGDAIMCFWNAPLDQPEHAALACRAALRLREREQALQAKFAAFGIDRMHTRIGINSGMMVVGNVGSEQKVNYTVIGDAVNLGSRLEGANKIYGSQILVAESTMAKVGGQFHFRKLDLLRVRGRSQPLVVYELLGQPPVDERLSTLTRKYEAAFDLCQNREWDGAERALVELLGEFADDGPAAALLKRVRKYRDQPPSADWDGAHDM